MSEQNEQNAASGDLPHQRDLARLKAFVERLPDPNDNPDPKGNTIAAFAANYRIELADVRSFREGNDDALPASTVKSIVDLLGRDTTIADFDPTFTAISGDGSRQWYSRAMRYDRTEDTKLLFFERSEKGRSEISAALDAYADLGAHGSVGESLETMRPFRPVVLNQTVRGGRQQTMLDGMYSRMSGRVMGGKKRWLALRSMAQFGRCRGETLFEQNTLGGYDVSGVLPLHVRTVRVNRQHDGTIDPERYWEQFDPKTGNQLSTYPQWKIFNAQHSKHWGTDEGTGVIESIARTIVQVEAMEASMIIRRAEHASRQLLFYVDTGDLPDAREKLKRVDDMRTRNKKTRTIDQGGVMQTQAIAIAGGESIFWPKDSKDSPSGVDVLESDASVAAIADVLHFFNKLLAGLCVPKAHLGYEGDTMRSVITDLHIAFARRVRRYQIDYIAAEKQLYDMQLILNGIDPNTVRYLLVPPSMGTRDELVRSQILMTYSTVVKNLSSAFAASGKVPSPEWYLRAFMQLPPEMIEQLDLLPVVNQAAKDGNPSDPPSKRSDPGANDGEKLPERISQVFKDRDYEMLHYAESIMPARQVAMMRETVGFLCEERALATGRYQFAHTATYGMLARPSDACDEVAAICQQLGIANLAAA